MGTASAGWETKRLAGLIREVVVVNHPNGTVWAFTYGTMQTPIDAWQLVSLNGAVDWVVNLDLFDNFSVERLDVQYLNDRPATPLVSALSADGDFQVIQPSYDLADRYWKKQPKAKLPTTHAEIDAGLAVAFDDIYVNTARIYTVVGGSVVAYVVDLMSSQVSALVTDIKVDEIVGVWSQHYVGGFVGLVHQIDQKRDVVVCGGYDANGSYSDTMSLDQLIDGRRGVAGRQGLLHLYGIGAGSALVHFHQTGWRQNPARVRILQPIWEGHLDGTLPVATSLPLVAKVDAFATDAYPDAMPDQLVFHSGAAQGEPCAIYTQSVDGQYWSEERVRIPAQDSERTIVNRYQVVATVKSTAGLPMPMMDITVTADDPVDFEVKGSIYRTGPNTEARVTTDLTGRVIIRALPSGLAMPRLHLSVVGVSQSVTVNPAASIHQFLGGGGVLPNHGDGFTADAVLKATNPDGSYVFPGVARTTDDIGPTADELVKSCQLAFGVDQRQAAHMGSGGRRLQSRDRRTMAGPPFGSTTAARRPTPPRHGCARARRTISASTSTGWATSGRASRAACSA